MRKSYYLFVFLVGIAITCSKDDLIEDNRGKSQLPTSEVIVEVYPGGNDTEAIINAFKSASLAGRGSTVRLMPGEYRIEMIEVKEFFGKLEGSGKEKTIITNISDLTNENIKNPNNINAEGIMGSYNTLWPGGPVIDLPLFKFNGVKVAPEILKYGKERMYRCHGDANVNDCSLSSFSKGIYIWGCMEGNLQLKTTLNSRSSMIKEYSANI